MKKKIGILTFQRTTNYGAQLQNWALQEYLKQFKNLQVDVINYENAQVNNTEKQKKLSQLHGFKQIIKYFIVGNKKKKKWDKFEKFRNEYINLTKEFTKDNIDEIQNYYDYFLVGSDQVWNLEITDNDLSYLLDFVKDNRKKYSYAASIGMDNIDEEKINLIVNKLKEFKKINVREDSAQKLLEQNGLKNVSTVIDPTLLIDNKVWIEKFDLHSDKEKYIFVYMIDNVKENMKKIKRLAKKEHLKVVYISDRMFNILGIKNIQTASPIDFLNYIYNSKYVITGSFHAICFSLIFNKEFYYIQNKRYKRNSRMIDLIQKLNIRDKDITYTSEINISKINYKNVNSLMEKEINRSKKIIDIMINEWKENYE